MTESDCLFCQMAIGAFPIEPLYADDVVFAVRDINPRAPVHVIIVPRQHIPSVREMDESHAPVLAGLINAANVLAEQLGVKEDGFRLAINAGEHGGQTIFHLHMHLLGGAQLGSEA